MHLKNHCTLMVLHKGCIGQGPWFSMTHVLTLSRGPLGSRTNVSFARRLDLGDRPNVGSVCDMSSVSNESISAKDTTKMEDTDNSESKHISLPTMPIGSIMYEVIEDASYPCAKNKSQSTCVENDYTQDDILSRTSFKCDGR